MFAEDANHTLWTSGGGQVVGWLNTKMFEETGDEVKSQGWTALILDTNGNGKRDEYVEPNQPVDPAKDKRYGGAFYAVAPAPDGSVWGRCSGSPARSCGSDPGAQSAGDRARGSLRAAVQQPEGRGAGLLAARHGHRSQRRGLGGAGERTPGAASIGASARGRSTARTRPASIVPKAGRSIRSRCRRCKGVTDSGSAEASYYTWVDQFDTSGLGPNTPINTGNASEGLLALKDGKFVVLRVPYPTGYYTKWMDGRIDDPKAGWKGKGLWSTVSTRAPFHMETGKGTTSKVVKFQLRPDPLAK